MNTKQTEALKLALEALKMCRGLIRNNIENLVPIASPNPWFSQDVDHAITAIREELAEQPAQVDPRIDGSCSCCWSHLDEQPAQQQEPVAKVDYKQRDGFRWLNSFGWQRIPDGASLYTSPQASKPWVGLTKEDCYKAIRPLYNSDENAWLAVEHSNDEYEAIEAKLREKNA